MARLENSTVYRDMGQDELKGIVADMHTVDLSLLVTIPIQ